MKVSTLCLILEKHSDENDVKALTQALSKFSDANVSLLANKISRMKLPKVDPEEAATEMKSLFTRSSEFNHRLAEMKASRDYTKEVFFRIWEVLFPDEKMPGKATTRGNLVEKIRQERIDQENLAN